MPLRQDQLEANQKCETLSIFDIVVGVDPTAPDNQSLWSLFETPCWYHLTDHQKRIIRHIWSVVRSFGEEARALKISVGGLNRSDDFGIGTHQAGLAVDIFGPPPIMLWLFKALDGVFEGQMLIGSTKFARKGKLSAKRHLHFAYKPQAPWGRGIEFELGNLELKPITAANMRILEAEYGKWVPSDSPTIFDQWGNVGKYAIAALALYLLIKLSD